MASVKFDCSECGAHGTIKFKETDQYKLRDVVACPFCASDISDDSIDPEDELDD